MSRLTPLALGGAGLAVVLGAAAVSVGGGVKATSYATSSPGLAALSWLTGAMVFAAAALLASEPARLRVGLAIFGLGLAWSADAWAGWARAPTAVRNAGMLLVPVVAPATLVVIGTLAGGVRRAVAFGAAAAAIAGAIALWLVRDPFLDRYCWRDCLAPSAAPFTDVSLARTLTDLTLGLGAVCGLLVVLVAIGRPLWSWGPAILAGSVLAASDVTLLLEPAEDPERTLFAALFVARAVSLAALAVALVYVALRPRLVRRAISRLASRGGVAAALADALGDPGLCVGYPLPDGTVVDEAGEPVTFGRPPARVERGGELVALVGSTGPTPAIATLERALGPAARLALANERLRAEQLARLRELTDLRRRIVATGDAARRRLERDLHDGAQQRLLALAIDLRVAVNRADAAAEAEAAALLREALERTTEATAELREIAHGLFPSALARAGLAAALETLADRRTLVLSVALDDGRRFPDDVETAAYALVAEATASEAPVRVRVEKHEATLVVAVEGVEPPVAEDRIGAVGGTLTWTERRLEARFPVPPPA